MNIKKIRIARDVRIKELASFLNVNRDTYSRWENEIIEIPASKIISLAEYYSCSSDELLGIAKSHKKQIEELANEIIRLNKLN